MVNTDLKEIIDLLGKKATEQGFGLKLNSENVFFEIAVKKNKLFEELRKDIQEKWIKFKVKNDSRIIKKTYTTFLYNNFLDFYRYLISNFYGLNSEQLELRVKEKISDSNVFFELNYNLTEEESDLFEELKNIGDYPKYGIFTLTGYFFFITSALGMVLRKIIQEPLFIVVDGGVVGYNGKNKNIDFMVIVKDSRDEIYKNYMHMALYYFLKPFKGIPDEYYDKLLESREELYNIALEKYSGTKEKLIDLLYYFYKKCKIVGNFSPFLDFLNFVCSRVEDSKFDKITIIKQDFLKNFQYTVEKKNSLIKFFNFLDNKSTLYSTFQANNLPSPRAQFNLFLLYMKYYFVSGLEALEVSDLLYLPGIFKTSLNQYNLENEQDINSNSIKNIANFLNYVGILGNIKSFDRFFRNIFKKSIQEINYGFFRSITKSFNKKFNILIDEENEVLRDNPENEPFTYNIIVDHICRMLYTLIDKIFLKETPGEASENFNDPRGRYIGKNIALRVLELFIFQDMNFSDDIWPEYLISIKKRKIQKELSKFVKIPDDQFYSDRDISNFLITYNFQSDRDDSFFEEWLITEIIIPLNIFIESISSSVKDPSNSIEVYEKLKHRFLEGIKEKDKKKEFKIACEQLAPFWKIYM